MLGLDPAVLLVALAATCLIFACYSLSVMYSSRRQVIFVSGFLTSAISTLFWLQIANLFFRSHAIFTLELYLGLLAFSGFVVYDTQLMIIKADAGDHDYQMHSLNLFQDFIGLFVRIVAILNDKKSKKRRSRDE